MRNYIHIAATDEKHLLIIKGQFTGEELENIWEKICIENGRHNGDNSMTRYHQQLSAYGKLLAKYELVRLHLMKLVMVVDDASVAYLASNGFAVNISAGSLMYAESINKAMDKSSHLITRIHSKFNEVKELLKNQGKNTGGIESSMASMSAVLGFNLPDNLSLARFNEYRKIVKAKTEKR